MASRSGYGVDNVYANPSWATTPPQGWGQGSDWTTLIQNDLNNRVSSNYDSGNQTQNQTLKPGTPGVHVPQRPEGPDFDPNNLVYHYICHPRLMPALGDIDKLSPPLALTFLVPYKVAKIKRNAEIAYIMDGSLAVMSSGARRGFRYFRDSRGRRLLARVDLLFRQLRRPYRPELRSDTGEYYAKYARAPWRRFQ